jgi:hypothetical protein
MHWFVPILKSMCWHLHVSAVACSRELIRSFWFTLNANWMGGISYNVWLRDLCAGLSWFPADCTQLGSKTDNVWYTTRSICISSNSEGSKKLPDDGRLLPKHVGASMQNNGVVQISEYCWLFLLRLIMHGTNIKANEQTFWDVPLLPFRPSQPASVSSLPLSLTLKVYFQIVPFTGFQMYFCYYGSMMAGKRIFGHHFVNQYCNFCWLCFVCFCILICFRDLITIWCSHLLTTGTQLYFLY